MVLRMDNAGLRLELVPMDGATGDEAPASAPAKESSPTTSRAQDAVTAAEAALDAIDIKPMGRAVPKLGDTQSIDPFVARALRECASGQTDKPAWERALTQVNGDAAAAETAYVRLRAAVLRAEDRQRREARRAALEAPDVPYVEPLTVWQRYKMAIVAAAVLVPAGIVGAMLLTSGGDDAEPPVRVAVRAPAKAAVAPAPAAQAVVKPAPTNEALGKKVQELRDAGNFNVMALYATEWTRKEPTNAMAWDELRVAYVQLRQYEDARNAAKKAVQLAPDEARLWRSLASVNMDIDDPEAALAAYEQVAARNATDVESLNAIGLLHARLGRSQEAKNAFDRAAAASPGDPVTTCLRNGVAQMPPTRDPYTMSRQVRALDNRCHGRSDEVATAR